MLAGRSGESSVNVREVVPAGVRATARAGHARTMTTFAVDHHLTRPAYGAGTLPLAVAHRGGAALGPENTAAAFEGALALGFTHLETDVRLTRDGVLVAFHDEHLLRTTGVDRPINRTDWSVVRRLPVLGTASRVERMDDLLAAFPQACFSIDVKVPEVVEPLAEAIRRTGSAGRVCVGGGWDQWLTEIRVRVGPQLSWALGWRSLASLMAAAETGVRPVRLPLGGFVHLPPTLHRLPLLRRRTIALAHELGQRVVAWTIDDPDEIRDLLDRGVDGIMTDRPDVLRQVLVERGQWPTTP